MNKLAASIIGSFLVAGALVLASCSNDTTTTGSGTPPIFGGNNAGPGTGKAVVRQEVREKVGHH